MLRLRRRQLVTTFLNLSQLLFISINALQTSRFGLCNRCKASELQIFPSKCFVDNRRHTQLVFSLIGCFCGFLSATIRYKVLWSWAFSTAVADGTEHWICCRNLEMSDCLVGTGRFPYGKDGVSMEIQLKNCGIGRPGCVCLCLLPYQWRVGNVVFREHEIHEQVNGLSVVPLHPVVQVLCNAYV